MKQYEWKLIFGTHEHRSTEHYGCGKWRITIDPLTKIGHISKLSQKSPVEYLTPGLVLLEGLGIPKFVVDKANELTRL